MVAGGRMRVTWEKIIGASFVLGTVTIFRGAGPRNFPDYRAGSTIGQKIITDGEELLLKEVSDNGPVDALR